MNATTDVMLWFRGQSKNIVRLGEILLHFLFPVSCPVCGRMGVKICPECRDYLPSEKAVTLPYRLLPALFSGEIITRKIGGLTVYSASRYREGNIRPVIHRFKYKGARELGRPLGKHMAEIFGECRADYLVPVPLHLGSKRGYNQSLELAIGMCEIWDAEIFSYALWTRKVPRRATSSTRHDLTYEDFRFTRDIYGKRVALVDDVCTSGETLACLAETCRREGAEVVCAYTLASA